MLNFNLKFAAFMIKVQIISKSLYVLAEAQTLGGAEVFKNGRNLKVSVTSQDSTLTPYIQNVGNPCSVGFGGGACQECTGDCDSDSDCDGDLRCAQRRGVEDVPGCAWDGSGNMFSGTDFCFMPTSEEGVINYVGECNASRGYLCKLCEGDCDNDSDCEGNLICAQRSGFEAVDGCSGEGGTRDMKSKDICITPSTVTFNDSLTISATGCTVSSPCIKCVGSCFSDSDCESGLICFQRSGVEPIPNCVTGGVGDISDANYCYEQPTLGDVTYIPGEISKTSAGLDVSTGLQAKIIARSGRVMPGSGESFHYDPDAGAVFPISEGENSGGWIYVSNAEVSNGGVGAIIFNGNGDVIDYKMIMTGTSTNCGGGKTYWGTWVSCEESSGGQVHEVDPYVGVSTQRQTLIGGSGGRYESFAYDARDRMNPSFYVTHDSSSGGLVRFTPDAAVVEAAERTGDYSGMLTTSGSLHWLVLIPSDGTRYATSGTFRWTTNRNEADDNAYAYYRSSEGIDIRAGMLYFTTKTWKYLYILDLDAMTYTRSSTVSGAFEGQPDQIQRILADDNNDDMLYFCEEASSVDNGVHARDQDGNFYTILNGGMYSSETTGLAFSPDNKHMYLSYQSDGIIFDISREDGYPFGAHRLDIKYHAS